MNLIDWIKGKKDASGDAVALVTSNPEQVGAAMEEGRREIEKLRQDAEWAANRFRDDLEEARKYTAQLETTDIAKDAEISQLKTAVAVADKSADEKARDMVRRAGHAPVAISQDPAAAAPTGAAKILVDYRALTPGSERLKFATENRAALKTAHDDEKASA
jgi:hypothetical protein